MRNIIKSISAIAVVGLFAACNADKVTEETPKAPLSISIAKQAEFKMTSGGRMLVQSANTRAVQDESLLFFKKTNCPDLYKANFPDQKLYKEECEHVYACIKQDAALLAEGKAPVFEVDKNSFKHKAFYIVNAYSSKDHDAKGGHSDVAGDMHDLGLNGVYIKEFNTNTCVAADLILTEKGLLDVTYDDSFGVKKQNYTVSEWKLFFIPDYGYYVGMDYGSSKFGTDPDGDYSDWVVKLIPAKKSVDPVDDTNGQVEINLSVNDEHQEGDFIATKLSIHVRALTDVEILIPVDKSYYCLADDMDISLSHKQADIIYNTQPQYVQKQIGANIVKFQVAYEDDGIHVTTDGINKQVIDFCSEMYADGITFEVWNYFKNITRDNLKGMLNKTTVSFLSNDPKQYVNAFAKLKTSGYDGPIYNKFNDKGQLVPYKDSECTQPLEQAFWTRINADDKDYIFIGVQNPWDCTVAPTDASYKASQQDPSDPTLSDYNVTYTKN